MSEQAEQIIEITQERGKGKTLCATLVKERELRVENVLSRKSLSFCVDVLALNDESKRKVVFAWKWALAGLLAVLVSLLVPSILSSLFTEPLYTYLVYLAGASTGAACFYMAWKATSVRQVFYSRNAEVPIIKLIASKPSRKEFGDFVNRVEESIRAIQDKMNLSMKRQLAGEMRMLRRLSEEGVISPSDYKKAQASLLSKH